MSTGTEDYSKLFNDDCFNILPKLEKKSVDLVIVDLPYNQTSCEWDVDIDLKKMWIELKRICKPNTTFCFFTTTKYGVDLINSNPRWFKYDLVWEKTQAVGFLTSNKMPLRAHEMIYIFGNPSGGKKTYNVQKVQGGKPYDRGIRCCYTKIYKGMENNEIITTKNIDGSRFPRSVMKVKAVSHTENLHPTQKPVEILDFLIKSYSNEGDTIIDFTMGSGSTGVSCKTLNRKFIGIELNKEFFEIANKRINKPL